MNERLQAVQYMHYGMLETAEINSRYIDVIPDNTMAGGFKTNAKWVGNALDEIISEMIGKHQKVPIKLIELKQFLRFKGNSMREKGDLRLWESENDR